VTVVEAEAKKLSGATSYAEAARSPAVRQSIQEAIDRVNATLPAYETVKRFTILDRDFSQETGELTPTLKVKRKLATQKFKKEIDAMYEGESIE
jgi:long-chain acyl-CoA synthetase